MSPDKLKYAAFAAVVILVAGILSFIGDLWFGVEAERTAVRCCIFIAVAGALLLVRP